MGFFGPSQSKRAALDARHAAKLAEIQSKFAAEEAERARLDAEEEATYLRKLELLSRNALFDAMTEDDLDALAGVMRRVEVKAGKRVLRHEPKSERDRASKRGVVTSLFGAGKAKGKPAARARPPPDDDAFDRDEAFYVVDSGSLDVSVADEGVAVTLHPGDAVGELDKLFLAPRDRSVTVVANVDAVLWAVPGRTLRRKRGFQAVVAKAAATRAAWDPLLVAVPLLASALTPFQRAFLTAKLRPRRFESHEPVATEDEEARECWMLMEGECAAYAGARRRRRTSRSETFPGRPFRRGVPRASRPRLRTHRPRGCERRGTRTFARGGFQRGVRSKRDAGRRGRVRRGDGRRRVERRPRPRRRRRRGRDGGYRRTGRRRAAANAAHAVASPSRPRRIRDGVVGEGGERARIEPAPAGPETAAARRSAETTSEDANAGPKRAGPPARVGDGLGGGTREGDGPERGDAEEDFEDVGVDDWRRSASARAARTRRAVVVRNRRWDHPPRETRVSRVSWRVSRRTRCSKARNVARFAPPSPRWNCASCLRAASYFARANAAIICTSSKPASWTSPRRIPRGVPRAARRARGVDRSWVTWR